MGRFYMRQYEEALQRKSRFNKTARAILGLLENSWRFPNEGIPNVIYDILEQYTDLWESVDKYLSTDESYRFKYRFYIFAIPKDIRQKLENAWAKIEPKDMKEPTLFDKIKDKLEQKRQEKIKEQEEFERKEKEIYEKINNLF